MAGAHPLLSETYCGVPPTIELTFWTPASNGFCFVLSVVIGFSTPRMGMAFHNSRRKSYAAGESGALRSIRNTTTGTQGGSSDIMAVKRAASREPSVPTPRAGQTLDHAGKSRRKDSLYNRLDDLHNLPSSTTDRSYGRKDSTLMSPAYRLKSKMGYSWGPLNDYSTTYSSAYPGHGRLLSTSSTIANSTARKPSPMTSRGIGSYRPGFSVSRTTSASSSSRSSDEAYRPQASLPSLSYSRSREATKAGAFQPTTSFTKSSATSLGSNSLYSMKSVRDLSGRLSSMDLNTSKDYDRGSKKGLSETTESKLSKGSGRCGLWNLGNTCYQNSTIQVLNGVPELVEYFHGGEEWKNGVKLSREFARVIQQLWSKPHGSVVSLDSFHTSLGRIDRKWTRGSQEDAHEFLTCILETLKEECTRNSRRPQYRELKDREDLRLQAEEEWLYSKQWNNSAIDDFFGFQLHSRLTCPQCSFTSNRFDYVTELELPIPKQNYPTLEDCLTAFTDPEKLGADNEWYCGGCKTFVRATKKISIYRLPQVLVVTLKRFSSTDRAHSFRAWKNTTPVTIPTDGACFSAALSPLARGAGTHFHLTGIVDHSGSLTAGHYTARAKSAIDGKWYNFNDSQVNRVEEPRGPQVAAYTLVFRRGK